MTGSIGKTVTVGNRRGLHARASAKFVNLAEEFDAQVKVTGPGTGTQPETVSGTSIMGLMMLAAGTGQDIHIEASGNQAEEALNALVSLVENKFEED
ncbi:MAG: HPr family phosphocarrier protein [Alphaproteobacteria bacterium]